MGNTENRKQFSVLLAVERFHTASGISTHSEQRPATAQLRRQQPFRDAIYCSGTPASRRPVYLVLSRSISPRISKRAADERRVRAPLRTVTRGMRKRGPHDQETIAKAIFGKTIRQEPDTIPDEGRKYAEPGMGTTVPAGASR